MTPPMAATSAMLQCTFGMAPSTLSVLPISRVFVEGKPVAAITDNITAMNIPPFGMCQSLANPTVAAATAAALGVLTPMPCIPATPAPWTPGMPTVLVAGKPVLTAGSMCMCAFGGVITMTFPGTTRSLAG